MNEVNTAVKANALGQVRRAAAVLLRLEHEDKLDGAYAVDLILDQVAHTNAVKFPNN